MCHLENVSAGQNVSVLEPLYLILIDSNCYALSGIGNVMGNLTVRMEVMKRDAKL